MLLVLFILGGSLFFKESTRQVRQSGRIAIGNVFLRGSGAGLILIVLHVTQPSWEFLGTTLGQQLLHFHLIFSLLLLITRYGLLLGII